MDKGDSKSHSHSFTAALPLQLHGNYEKAKENDPLTLLWNHHHCILDYKILKVTKLWRLQRNCGINYPTHPMILVEATGNLYHLEKHLEIHPQQQTNTSVRYDKVFALDYKVTSDYIDLLFCSVFSLFSFRVFSFSRCLAVWWPLCSLLPPTVEIELHL